jgi:ribonuclease P protein component
VTDRREAGPGAQAVARQTVGGQTSGRFRRQSRLLKHADFDRVYRNGRRHFAARMTFFYLPQGEQRHAPLYGPRVGLTVGRALGGAVARNRLKRRMREAVRFSLGELAVPVDVVINPKRSAATAEFSELRTEVRQGFRAIEQKLQKGKTSSRPAERNQK